MTAQILKTQSLHIMGLNLDAFPSSADPVAHMRRQHRLMWYVDVARDI